MKKIYSKVFIGLVSMICLVGCNSNGSSSNRPSNNTGSNNSSNNITSNSSVSSSITSSSISLVPTSSLTFEKGDNGYIVTGETAGVENIVIPETYEGLPVTEIGESAFASSKHLDKITSISIPDSVTIIHDNAFYDRTDLLSVTINKTSNLEVIENNAFSNNSSLQEIFIPKGLTRLGDEEEYNYPYSVFNNCGSLINITVDSDNEVFSSEGNALIEKASGKLIRGTNNTSITDDVTILGERSFTGINKMEELIIPTSITTIENYIISWSDTSIKTIRYLGTAEEWETVTKANSWDNDNPDYTLVFGPKVEEKAMVIYFSATSHTEKVAKTIAEHIDSPIFELEPVEPYSSSDLNYSNQNSRVVKEHNDPNRHVELKNTSFEGFDTAEYIFLGAPVWWQELSWVVDDFIKLNDFSNKTIIPFATSASSGFSITNLQSYTENATWLNPQRFSSNVNESNVINWVDGLNLSL